MVDLLVKRILRGGSYYAVYIDGNALSVEEIKSIQSITVKYAESGADNCNINMEISGILPILDRADLYQEGKPIQVYFSYVDNMVEGRKFNGYISIIRPNFQETGAPTLEIFCVDESYPLDRHRRTRTFTNMTTTQIVSHIAQKNGMRAKILKPTSFVIPQVVQREETDMQFLMSLLHQENVGSLIPDDQLKDQPYKEHSYTIKVKQGEIIFSERSMVGSPKKQLWYNSGDSSIRSFVPALVTNIHSRTLENTGDNKEGSTKPDIDPKTGKIKEGKNDTEKLIDIHRDGTTTPRSTR